MVAESAAATVIEELEPAMSEDEGNVLGEIAPRTNQKERARATAPLHESVGVLKVALHLPHLATAPSKVSAEAQKLQLDLEDFDALRFGRCT